MNYQDGWKDKITITMDQLLIGNGWYEVEKKDDFYYRWIGPDREATLHLNICRERESRLNLTIQAAASDDILNSICIEADGVRLYSAQSKEREPSFITSILPPSFTKIKNEVTILKIKLSNTIEVDENNKYIGENRYLGVAIRQIDIFPLSRALFVAEKNEDPKPFDGIQYLRNNPKVRDAVISGLCSSAYDYYVKNKDSNEENECVLYDRFDECPGDMFDILKEEIEVKEKILKREYEYEINRLRKIIDRQGENIRMLINRLDA